MKPWAKGVLIGIFVWVLLLILYAIAPANDSCLNSNYVGTMCLGGFEETIIGIFFFLSFPFTLFMGATPNVSTSGPGAVKLFWVGTFICLALWGMLINLIINKLRKTK